MAHYALIVNDRVEQVIVAEQEFVDAIPGEWVRTSYNTREGVHYGDDGKPDGGEALRLNYAGIGCIYDRELDAFYPPSPGPGWILDKKRGVWVSTPPAE